MEKKYNYDDFMNIIRQLRGENGCPWDREQTHESLRNCLIEEAYEVIEAINNKDTENLCEELGDILLQVALHTAIAEEQNEFGMEDVINGISKKMIHRHPHVFGNADEAAGMNGIDSETVIRNWDDIKKEEKNQRKASEGILSVPKALPANIRAEKVQKKAAKVGFDFENYNQALEKVYEELNELKLSKEKGDVRGIEEEFGDLMFSVVNLSRFLELNAENSLTNATNKFINRFVGIERLAELESKSLSEMSIVELDALWGRVK
ncbi:nucleoside triphosphate pyrophosphohydrolase [Anaerocolumna sedimenticola]|uniref:Nucleoside triphosphate pyrophosphohydrolase n=1 Tax=Anaerocolumna sedimenticola TaxID=2696063 RepID=A0A6P1TJK4_9FIRM|nr:nucleoside triphosphate pyrophosphohydrolase [Anaerocolumna sedimenticola]QHQ60487.1 nucleoside triphosphate pyrophosphohydrolase [Anaerocolumna sedimenticola]